MKYNIIHRGTRIVLDTVDTYTEALEEVKRYEMEDKRDDVYEPNAYKIEVVIE